MRLETRFEAIQEAIAKNPEAGEEEEEELLELIKEYRQVEERGFKHFMKSFIEDWVEDVRNGDRNEAPCKCDLRYCNLKEGKVPSGVKNKMGLNSRVGSDKDAKEATEEYLFETIHGDPVLEEALDEWNSKLAEIEQEAMKLLVRVKPDEEESKAEQ